MYSRITFYFIRRTLLSLASSLNIFVELHGFIILRLKRVTRAVVELKTSWKCLGNDIRAFHGLLNKNYSVRTKRPYISIHIPFLTHVNFHFASKIRDRLILLFCVTASHLCNPHLSSLDFSASSSFFVEPFCDIQRKIDLTYK